MAYAAGAAGMPCAIFRGYLGSDLVASRIRASSSIVCPFTGERLAAVPALRPDVTVIHAQKADRRGNVLISGIVGVQKEAVLAAATAVVTVEEIVDDLGTEGTNAVVLPVVDDRRDRRWRPAAPVRRTRMVTTSATTPSTPRGTRSRAIASASAHGSTTTCGESVRRAGGVTS